MKKLRIGIMGTGSIAATMARTVNEMPEAEIYAAASRTKEKAEVFAGKFGIEKAYGSYEELVSDEKVDLVYIATPMSAHYENAILSLNHGKHVLCEKSFAVNAQQTEEMLNLAKEKNLLIAEAMWVRYMPMRKTLNQVLKSGVIGTPTAVTANLCYPLENVERLMNPELGGGALLDVGVYVLNFASIVFGNEIEKMVSTAVMTDTGVDAHDSITIIYPEKKMAMVNASLRAISDKKGVIYGTNGYVVVEDINNFESIAVYNMERKQIAFYERPVQITGYEYEVQACKTAIENGTLECPEMPHSEILAIMRQMDALREQWGFRFPMEK